MYADFQVDGSSPEESDCVYTSVSMGAMSSASSLKMRQGSSSGPPALDESTSRRGFATPFSHIFRLAAGGMLGPSSTVSACTSSVVKTEENWWFNMSALDWLSECSSPSRLSGDTPQLSWRCDFTYRQKGFELRFYVVTEHSSDVGPAGRS